jgi:hypothetical protein
VKKTIELFNKKYHWSRMIKYVKFYIKTCDICQRTKTFKHLFYDDLQFLFFSKFVTKDNHEFHYKSFV